MKVASQTVCGERLRFSPVLFALLLARCASFSPDGGMGAVNVIVAPALRQDAIKVSGDDEAADTSSRVQGLLTSPLSAQAAVRVALLNNKGLQAAYNELGMAESVMVEASLPPNPRFSVSGISTPVELDIEARKRNSMSNVEWTLLVAAIAGVLVVLAILKLAFEEQAQDRNRNGNHSPQA